MVTRAVILNTQNQPFEGNFEIETDADFDVIEESAKSKSEPCCIHWSRSEDGQAAYWGPRGASFDPYWYNDER